MTLTGMTLAQLNLVPAVPVLSPEMQAHLDTVLARNQAVYGGFRMDADGDTPPADGDKPAEGAEGDKPAEGAEGDKPAEGEPAKAFSQADMDALAAKIRGEESKKAAKAIKDAQELAGKSEQEKVQIERDRAVADLEAFRQAADLRVLAAEAQVAAIQAGADPTKVAKLVKNADLSEVKVTDGTVDGTALKAAIDAALTEFPEWKLGAVKPGGPAGGPSGADLGNEQTKDQPKTLADALTALMAKK